jgi:hypothetical protein
MRSPHCVFRNRFIALSICLCALLAFSTTLSANGFTFVLGNVNSSEYYQPLGEPTIGVHVPQPVPVGPYAGVLTNDPNHLFFCITGGNTSSPGNPGYTGSEAAPSSTSTEEAAYLASLALSTAVLDKIIVSSDGTSVSLTPASGSTWTVDQFVLKVLGPIQMAIWQVMTSLPGEAPWYDGQNDTNTLTQGFVTQAINNHGPATAYSNFIIFTPDNTSSQSFIQVPSVPEPGTMVLFGTGVLLMGLGSTRKLLARRRAR